MRRPVVAGLPPSPAASSILAGQQIDLPVTPTPATGSTVPGPAAGLPGRGRARPPAGLGARDSRAPGGELYRRAGFAGGDSPGTRADMVRQLGQIPLEVDPGSRWIYGISTDLVGYLCEVISGLPFDRYLDEPAYVGWPTGVPGPDAGAALWLAERGIHVTGSDTIAYEWLAPGAGHGHLPVHVTLLVDNGIHIIEVLDLEELAADGVHEFLFVCSPLKLVGATGSPVRPLALVGA